ncbi:MAG: hypothetical protein J1E59_08145 [Treponema sp.]|nr:hypothetical protein [Treponema sp.]
MAEDRRPQAVWEPGTLDATRKNIGAIDAAEAARMTKILGGEIMTEKSAPIDHSKLPKRPSSNRVVGATPRRSSSQKSGSENSRASSSSSEEVSAPKSSGAFSLPPISAKDNLKIDRLMMSSYYAIKPNYGLFNFVKHFSKNGSERVIPEFAEITIKAMNEHFEAFVGAIKTLIQASPDTYKSKIQTDLDLKFRLLRKVSEWSARDIKLSYVNLGALQDTPVVSDLIPFVKAMYKQVITIYYLGENVVSKSIKEVYTDILHYPNIDKVKFANLAKSAVNEWNYIYLHIIKGLYPLLMRMCGTQYSDFPYFFTNSVQQILNFVGLKKFDLLLAEKKPDSTEVRQAKEGENKPANDAETQKKEQAAKEAASRVEMRERGISLLNRLFPGAGWERIDTFPDLWPYFDPLYDFDDCFLLLAPENPMQITIVLCEILQDFFHACIKMKFDMDANPLLKTKEDNFVKAMSEWPVYVDTLFEKEYGEPLNLLANQIYSQPNYLNTHSGKKTVTEILWTTKYSFLPFFSFEQLLLERPLNNSKYLPLSIRTAFLKSAFDAFVKQAAQVEAAKGMVGGFENPWEHYEFEFESPISKRMDVLLNAKDHGPNMTATNMNLIKYISHILAVLDWWINDKTSPAYKADAHKIYRTRPGTTEPAFSMEPRDDQDKLFAAAIRAMIQKKAAQ